MTPSPGEPLSDSDLDRFTHGTFTRVRFREGYNIDEVDAFIGRAVQALSSPTPSMLPEDVRSVRFTPVQVRQSYAMGEVDAYLDDLEQHLMRRRKDQSEQADS